MDTIVKLAADLVGQLPVAEQVATAEYLKSLLPLRTDQKLKDEVKQLDKTAK